MAMIELKKVLVIMFMIIIMLVVVQLCDTTQSKIVDESGAIERFACRAECLITCAGFDNCLEGCFEHCLM